MRRILPLLWVGVALAGCASPMESAGVEPAASADAALALAPQTLTWEGYLRVGAAREVPAHYDLTEPFVGALWRSGFVVEIVEAPTALEVRLDWTSVGPSDVLMMVHGPHGAERQDEKGWSEYTTDFEATGPLCMSIPPEDIVEDLALAAEYGGHHGGHWYPMAHSMYGADVALTFTVTSVGGQVNLVEMVHGHETTPEELMNAPETLLGPKRPWSDCSLATA